MPLDDRFITDLMTSLNYKVAKESGKGLSTNDFTDSLKTKLESLSTSAEENIIEDIKVNGSSLTITDKSVDITVPTNYGDLKSDGTVTMGSSYTPTNDKDIATKEYVDDNTPSGVLLADGSVSLSSSYTPTNDKDIATKEYVDDNTPSGVLLADGSVSLSSSYTPSSDYNIATKKYVDDNSGGGSSTVFELLEAVQSSALTVSGTAYEVDAPPDTSSFTLSNASVNSNGILSFPTTTSAGYLEIPTSFFTQSGTVNGVEFVLKINFTSTPSDFPIILNPNNIDTTGTSYLGCWLYSSNIYTTILYNSGSSETGLHLINGYSTPPSSIYVKMVQNRNVTTSYYSTNGIDWTQNYTNTYSNTVQWSFHSIRLQNGGGNFKGTIDLSKSYFKYTNTASESYYVFNGVTDFASQTAWTSVSGSSGSPVASGTTLYTDNTLTTEVTAGYDPTDYSYTGTTHTEDFYASGLKYGNTTDNKIYTSDGSSWGTGATPSSTELYIAKDTSKMYYYDSTIKQVVTS